MNAHSTCLDEAVLLLLLARLLARKAHNTMSDHLYWFLLLLRLYIVCTVDVISLVETAVLLHCKSEWIGNGPNARAAFFVPVYICVSETTCTPPYVRYRYTVDIFKYIRVVLAPCTLYVSHFECTVNGRKWNGKETHINLFTSCFSLGLCDRQAEAITSCVRAPWVSSKRIFVRSFVLFSLNFCSFDYKIAVCVSLLS